MFNADQHSAFPESLSFAAANRREHSRVPGPFDGWRVAAIETRVRLYDLCEGGCFVNSLHEQKPGVPMTFQIELPAEGTITVDAVTLARQDRLGFAVKFVRISADDAARLDRCLARLRGQAGTHA